MKKFVIIWHKSGVIQTTTAQYEESLGLDKKFCEVREYPL